MGALQEDQYTFMTISRWFIFIIRHFSDKSCRENQNTHFCSINFSRKCCCLWDDVYSRIGHIWQYGACALHAGWNNHNLCHWLPTATMVTRMCLNFMLRIHCLFGQQVLRNWRPHSCGYVKRLFLRCAVVKSSRNVLMFWSKVHSSTMYSTLAQQAVMPPWHSSRQ